MCNIAVFDSCIGDELPLQNASEVPCGDARVVFVRRGNQSPALFEGEICVLTMRCTLAFCFCHTAFAIALAAPAQILGRQSGDCARLRKSLVGFCPLRPRLSCYRRISLRLTLWIRTRTMGFSCTKIHRRSFTCLLDVCAVARALLQRLLWLPGSLAGWRRCPLHSVHDHVTAPHQTHGRCSQHANTISMQSSMILRICCSNYIYTASTSSGSMLNPLDLCMARGGMPAKIIESPSVFTCHRLFHVGFVSFCRTMEIYKTSSADRVACTNEPHALTFRLQVTKVK